MTILGIDPGKAATGWGVIKIKSQKSKAKNRLECTNYGTIKTTPEFKDPERLRLLFNEMNKLIRDYKPDVLAIEKLYFFKNLKTAIGVSQAKGVILLTGSKKKLPIHEFTPLQIKISITGYGRAKKVQVQKMVKELLNLKKIPRPNHAADALGAAICCAYELGY